MLIVIVIIGILIAALLPRMQGAQARARDVARQSDLSQVATALVAYQGDNWAYPDGADDAKWAWFAVDANPVSDALDKSVGMNAPKDPQTANPIGLGDVPAGSYAYKALGVWFVLVAKVETKWYANFCGTTWTLNEATTLSGMRALIWSGTNACGDDNMFYIYTN